MTQPDQTIASEITLVAVVQAKPEHEQAVADILKAAVEPSRNEDGCRKYTLHEDREAPGRFVFIERWSDAEALSAHERTGHFLRLRQLLPPHVEGEGEIMRLRCLD